MAIANDAGELGELMTLAAIAYANGSYTDATVLKGDIAAELANSSYATAQAWTLAFGPLRFEGSDSMMYVARKAAANPTRRAAGSRSHGRRSYLLSC